MQGSQSPPMQILYIDPWYVVVNKPNDLLVHRTSLAEGDGPFALQLLRGMLGGEHVYPCHRLDRPTSGVLVFGRSPQASAAFQRLQEQHAIDKRYWAVVRGFLSRPQGRYENDIRNKYEEVYRPALTGYRVLQQLQLPLVADPRYAAVRYALVEASPLTGRTHQIRLHLKYDNHPIVGDTRYGDNTQNRFAAAQFGNRHLLLHARSLGMRHPFTGAWMYWQAPPSENFASVAAAMGFMLGQA